MTEYPSVQQVAEAMAKKEQEPPTLKPWEFISDKGKIEVNTHLLADHYKQKSHFFYTSNYMAGYYYNGQHWERMQGKEQRDLRIRNDITTMLGAERYSPKLVTSALRVVLDTSMNDTLTKAFDKNPNVISFKNKSINVVTLEELDNSPNLYLLNGLDYDIDTSGTSPRRHIQFMDDILGDARQFVTEYIGYMFKRTYNPFQTFVIIQGGAGTGKSTLLNIITQLIGGTEKVSPMSLQELATDKFAPYSLVDKMANIRSDIGNLMITKPDIIKQVTGDDTITVERKGEQSFSYQNHAKLLYTANIAPLFAEDMGIQRRALLIKINGRVYSDRDHTTSFDYSPYIEELPRMAYYVIQQYAYAEKSGTWSITDTIRKDTDDWLYQGNDIAQWRDEHLVYDEGRRPKSTDIYGEFKKDMTELGFKNIPTSKTFLAELRKLGHTIKQSGTISALDVGGTTSRLIDYKYVSE